MRAAPGKYPEPCCSRPSWDSSDLVSIRAGHWALPGDWCRWQLGLSCPRVFAVLLNTAVGLGLVVLVKCQGKPVATGTQCYQKGEISAQPHCYSNIQPQSLGELKTEFSPCFLFFFRVLLRITFFFVFILLLSWLPLPELTAQSMSLLLGEVALGKVLLFLSAGGRSAPSIPSAFLIRKLPDTCVSLWDG